MTLLHVWPRGQLPVSPPRCLEHKHDMLRGDEQSHQGLGLRPGKSEGAGQDLCLLHMGAGDKGKVDTHTRCHTHTAHTPHTLYHTHTHTHYTHTHHPSYHSTYTTHTLHTPLHINHTHDTHTTHKTRALNTTHPYDIQVHIPHTHHIQVLTHHTCHMHTTHTAHMLCTTHRHHIHVHTSYTPQHTRITHKCAHTHARWARLFRVHTLWDRASCQRTAHTYRAQMHLSWLRSSNTSAMKP